MAFNYSKLRGKIVEVFGGQNEFAKAMGWSERTLSRKMTSKVSWKQTDILKAISLLKISNMDIQEYFFTIEVQDI